MNKSFRRSAALVSLFLTLAYASVAQAGTAPCNTGGSQPPSVCSARGVCPSAVSLARTFGGTETLRSAVGDGRAALYASTHPDAPALQPQAVANVPAYTAAFAIGGTGDTLIGATATDPAGNIVVAGAFWGTITFPTSPSPTSFTSSADSDVFVAKFTPGGQCVWARVAKGAANAPAGLSIDGALSVATDAQSNVYVGGGFVGSLSFVNSQGATVSQLLAGAGGWNFEAFVARYDASGNLTWAQGGMSGSSRDANDLDAGVNGVTSLATDASGNLFAAGTASGTAFLGVSAAANPNGSAFVARLNPNNGLVSWIQILTDNNDATNGYDGVLGLGSDNAGGVIALGFWEGHSIAFPTQPQATTLAFDSEDDGFLARFNNSGQCLWARLPADSGFTYVGALAVTSLGQSYVTGSIGGNAVFNGKLVPGPTFLDSNEAFVAKYDSAGNGVWVRTLNSTDLSAGLRISTDQAGNAYVMGWNRGQSSITDNLNDGPGVVIGASGYTNLFLGLFDAVGTPRWLRALSSPRMTNTGLQTATIDIMSGGLSYNAFSKTLVLGGDFAGSLSLDNLVLNAANPAQYSFLAAIPTADGPSGPSGTNPAIRATIGGTGWASNGNYYVSLTLTNTGSTTAYNATVNAVTLRSLNGMPVSVAGPALPASYGDIATGASVTNRIYFGAQTGARFVMTASISLQNQAAAKLVTSAGFSITAN